MNKVACDCDPVTEIIDQQRSSSHGVPKIMAMQTASLSIIDIFCIDFALHNHHTVNKYR